MFYRVVNLPIKKVCIFKNFSLPNFSDFKRFVVALKINPQKYNWPRKIRQVLKNKFLGASWSFSLMQINQNEVYDMALVT